MGIATARVRISNLADPARSFEDEFIVDTGAVVSFAPTAKLESIGVAPTRSERLRLADGSIVTRPVGDVFFEIEGKRTAAPVIFADPSDATLLGAVTLEALALGVDPVSRKLHPVTLLAVGVRRT
ncbi:MAG: Retroviral aspartyl protease [Deltaproteobacteria bacterium]|nr:Retroviral aspartyl protease [Deltaproteobacteria bacterium]